MLDPRGSRSAVLLTRVCLFTRERILHKYPNNGGRGRGKAVWVIPYVLRRDASCGPPLIRWALSDSDNLLDLPIPRILLLTANTDSCLLLGLLQFEKRRQRDKLVLWI